MRIRSQPFPDSAALPYWLCDDDHALKAHPAYRQAKAGEQDAAMTWSGIWPSSSSAACKPSSHWSSTTWPLTPERPPATTPSP